MKNFSKLFCFSLATISLCSLAFASPKLISARAITSEDISPDEYYLYEESNNDLTNEDANQEDIASNPQNHAKDRHRQHIIVYGGGSVSAVPDIAYVTIGVESRDTNLQTAVEENKQTMAKVIGKLKEMGIEDRDIKTKYYSAYQMHSYTTNERFGEYEISNTIEFKTRDLDNLGENISTLTSLGANQLGGITFDCEDISSYYQEALKLAIQDAQNKVTAFTDKELSIVKINEECVYTCMPYRSIDMLASENTSVEKGSMEIEAKIKVIFAA